MAASDSQPSSHRLWPAATFQFALIAGVTQLKTAANALVLSRLESQALPYLYLLGALLTAAAALAPRGAPDSARESPGVLTAVGGLVFLGFAAVVSAGARLPVFAFYLCIDVFSTLVSLRFWGRMAAAFDAREARFAFTLFNGVGMGGGIAGGLLVGLLAERLGTAAVVASGALGLLSAAVAFRYHRGNEPPLSARERFAGQRAPWDYLVESPYARALAGLGVAFAVLTPFVDYLFRLRVEGTLSEDRLAALFGALQFWIGLLCVVFQLVVARPLLERLGVLRYLELVPLVLAPLAGAALVTPSLWPLYLLRTVETAINYSILPVGMQLLYAALPDERREAVRSTVDGLLRKGGVVLAGLLLIGAGAAANATTLAVVVCCLCLGLALSIYRLKPTYIEALGTVLVGPAAAANEDDELGRREQELLVEALSSPAPERVLRTVELMEQREVPLRPHLPRLLSHADEAVVERGVALALELSATETAPMLERLVNEGPRRLREQVVWALARLSKDRAERLLPPLLMQTADIALRCAAIAALFRMQGEWSTEALDSLRALVSRGGGAPVAERREVARLLGRMQDGRFAHFLVRYLEDADVSVRRAALEAVGVGGYVELAPQLLPLLSWREDRKCAREALAALGDAVTPLLEQALNDHSVSLAVRLQLPRVLRAIGSPACLKALLFSNVKDDARLHFRIGAELSRLRDEHPEHPVDSERVYEAIGRRRDSYRALVEPYRDVLAALGEGSLLVRAVGDRLDQALELSFFLLGLLFEPPQLMRRAHQHLVGNNPRRRAHALDLLEHVLSEEERAPLMEQVEAHHRELPPGAAGRLEQQLAALVCSEDVVLRACARHVARVRGLELPPPQEGDMKEEVVQRLFALEGVTVFAQNDVDDLAAVAAIAREARFRAGERIYSQGDPGDALYVIVEGEVEAIRNGKHVMSMQAKETFGDVSLLDGAPRPTDAVALRDTRVLVIDRRDFLDLLSDRPELLTGFFRAVSQQLRAFINLPEMSRPTAEYPLVSPPQPPEEGKQAPKAQEAPQAPQRGVGT